MMYNIQFHCELLTDIVLISNAATEGFHASLDYIPGAKFLGIAAGSLYRGDYEGNTKVATLFHSDKVQFGDAYPLINNERVLPSPLDWRRLKLEQDNERLIYQHHQLTDGDIKSLNEQSQQLKSLSESYFVASSNALVKVGQDFTIKSAYDRDLRRSKESAMYGYYALESGSTWCFSVLLEDASLKDKIITALTDKKHRIGRSKSAEYGLVDIKVASYQDYTASYEATDDTIYLYAASNWCFYQRGITTAEPALADLFPALEIPDDGTHWIDWEKSTIRTRPYYTWNAHRRNRDADRTIIQKGSVIAVCVSAATKAKLSQQLYEQGIGAHRKEGFGRVLYNPAFLNNAEKFSIPSDAITLNKCDYYAVTKGDTAQENLLLAILNKRNQQSAGELKVAAIVQRLIEQPEFQSRYDEVTNSQWGLIRKKARQAESESESTLRTWLFDDKNGLLKTGQSKDLWKAKDRAEHLESILFEQDAKQKIDARTLAIKLAKEVSIQNEEHDE